MLTGAQKVKLFAKNVIHIERKMRTNWKLLFIFHWERGSNGIKYVVNSNAKLLRLILFFSFPISILCHSHVLSLSFLIRIKKNGKRKIKGIWQISFPFDTKSDRFHFIQALKTRKNIKIKIPIWYLRCNELRFI